MKHIIAILLSTLLLFSMPASVEDAYAAGGGTVPPETESVLPPAKGPESAGQSTDTDAPVSPAQPEHTAQEEPEVPSQEESAPERVVDPAKPMVALTFDDGPHPTNTDTLLDILEANGAVATFFQVGQNLWKDPDAIRRAEAMGCEIGSHSYRHADLSKLSAEAIAADLQKADEAFIEVLGHAPTLLRPPYGSVNNAVKTTTGRSIITWSIDTEDWRSRNAEKVIASVKNEGDLDGQVILMHDIHASTIEAAETLVPWLIDQGYQLVTITELITLRYGDQVEPNRVYGYSYFKFETPPLPSPQPEAAPETTAQATAAPEASAQDPGGKTEADPPAAETPAAGDAAPHAPEGSNRP